MNSGLSDIARLCNAETFAFSAENPTGAKGGGSRGKPWEKLHAYADIKPGETLELVNTDGPGAVQSIWIGGYSGSDFILRMYWDSQEHPSVEAPLPAFFGYPFFQQVVDVTGRFPTLNSLPVLVAPCIGFNCYWEMPFRKRCRITMENRGNDPKQCYYMITGKRQTLPDNVAYFHASYRQERPLAPDQEYAVIDEIKGKGHFVGVAFAAGLNAGGRCWVEGEAKMFIDGDTWPTVNYTGTEDYFCGSYAFGNDAALGRYQTYSGPYVGMFAAFKSDGSEQCSQDRFMAYRWHIRDPIYFNTDFRMTLQSMEFTPHGGRTRRDDYSSVAFWYQSLPSNPLKPLPSYEDVYLK